MMDLANVSSFFSFPMHTSFMSKKKEYLIFFSILFAMVLAGTVFLELVWFPNKSGLPREALLMGFVGSPNSLVSDTPINSMGFTGDEISKKKYPETTRILTLGESTFFNRRLAERLKNHLAQISEKPVEVLGAALRQHTTQSSIYKYRYLSKYQFDYVIIYHGLNDLWANNVILNEFKEDYSQLDPWYKRNFWLDHSLLLRRLYNNLFFPKELLNKPYYPTKDEENLAQFSTEKIFYKNISTLIDEAKQSGAMPILMTFSWNIPDNYSKTNFESRMVGYNNPDNYDIQAVELWGSVEYVQEGLERHNRVIRRLAQEKAVIMIDQEKLMGKNLKWFGDFCHFSEEGTEKFIKNIADFFIENQFITTKDGVGGRKI